MTAFNAMFEVSDFQENDDFTYYEVKNQELVDKNVITGDLTVTSEVPDAVLTFNALACFEHDSEYNWKSIYENYYNWNDFAVADFFRKNGIKSVVEMNHGKVVGYYELNS